MWEPVTLLFDFLQTNTDDVSDLSPVRIVCHLRPTRLPPCHAKLVADRMERRNRQETVDFLLVEKGVLVETGLVLVNKVCSTLLLQNCTHTLCIEESHGDDKADGGPGSHPAIQEPMGKLNYVSCQERWDTSYSVYYRKVNSITIMDV